MRKITSRGMIKLITALSLAMMIALMSVPFVTGADAAAKVYSQNHVSEAVNGNTEVTDPASDTENREVVVIDEEEVPLASAPYEDTAHLKFMLVLLLIMIVGVTVFVVYEDHKKRADIKKIYGNK